jgi:hypothetical protein
MTPKPYMAQPGTIAARAIAHLRSLPPGTVLSSAQLAEALDLDDSKSIHPSLSTALKHGAVHQDAKADNKRILLWSLGDGKPRVAAAATEDPEDLAPLNPVPPIPKGAVIWPGLAEPPEDTRPAAVKSAELAWAKGTQKPHRGATPDVGDRRGRPPTTQPGAPAVATRGKGTAPMEFADIGAMQITNDPITPSTKVGGDKYSPLFSKMKLGQSIKCLPDDAPKVANAMRKWVKEQGTGAIVRAVRRYPADGLGRVWMLKPERAGT